MSNSDVSEEVVWHSESQSNKDNDIVFSNIFSEGAWNQVKRNSEISKTYEAVLKLDSEYSTLLNKLSTLESKIDILINKVDFLTNKMSYSPNYLYNPNLTPQTVCQAN